MDNFRGFFSFDLVRSFSCGRYWLKVNGFNDMFFYVSEG